jgi:hypothetical protein
LNIIRKGLRVAVELNASEVHGVCPPMVHFQRLGRLGLKRLKFSLCLRRVPRLVAGLGGTMRSGLCCRENPGRTGFKPFIFVQPNFVACLAPTL